MSQIVPGRAPLAYSGLPEPNPPNIWSRDRDPTTSDFRNYKIGDEWWNKLDFSFWKLVNKAGPVATWNRFAGPTFGAIQTINDIDPDADANFDINAGAGITITPGTNSITVSLTGGSTAIDSFIPDAGTNPVVPDAAGAVTMVGGNGILTTGGLNTLTFDMQSPFTGDFTFQSVTSGDTETLTVTNTSNTASSQAQFLASVAGATAGDAFQTFTVTGLQSWSHGIDNSASDAYVIAASTALGTTNWLQIETAGNATFFGQAASIVNAGAGIRVGFSVQNTSSAAGSSAYLALDTTNGSGDPYILLDVSEGSSQAVMFGLDTDDSNAYVIQLNPANGGGSMDGTTAWRMTVGVPGAGVGCITMPLQPAFSAILTTSTAGGVTGNGATYTLSNASGGVLSEIFDLNGNFDAATGTFTAPTTGRYYFHAVFSVIDITAAMTAGNAKLVTSTKTYEGNQISPAAAMDAGNVLTMEVSCFTQLTVGNTVTATLNLSNGAGNTANVSGAGATIPDTYFEGFLVC